MEGHSSRAVSASSPAICRKCELEPAVLCLGCHAKTLTPGQNLICFCPDPDPEAFTDLSGFYCEKCNKAILREKDKIRYKNEEDLNAGVVVFWKGKKYSTGNRYKDQVELYYNGDFCRTVKIEEVFSLNFTAFDIHYPFKEIEAVFNKYKHVDNLLSDDSLLDADNPLFEALGELWTAVKEFNKKIE